MQAVFQYLRIGGFALGAGIPAPVAVAAVAVVFAVAEIVFGIITDQIMQGKTVMCRHKVNAGRNVAVFMVEDIAGTTETAGQIGNLVGVAFPETAYRVAVFIIPLIPPGRERANLITGIAYIPRLGNKLNIVQYRILLDGIQKSTVFFKIGTVTA